MHISTIIKFLKNHNANDPNNILNFAFKDLHQNAIIYLYKNFD